MLVCCKPQTVLPLGSEYELHTVNFTANGGAGRVFGWICASRKVLLYLNAKMYDQLNDQCVQRCSVEFANAS